MRSGGRLSFLSASPDTVTFTRKEAITITVSKKFYLPVLGLMLVGATLLGTSQLVHAQSTQGSFAGLAQAIAQKFGLDQGQVQSTIDQYRDDQKTKMQQTMLQRQTDRLDQVEKDGKITDAQKQAILAENAALQAKYKPESLKDKTMAERRQVMLDERNEAEAWAKTQGIDPAYLTPRRGMMHRMGWQTGSVTPTPTATP